MDEEVRCKKSMERISARTWVSWLSTTKAMRVMTKRMTGKFPPRLGEEGDRSERRDMSRERDMLVEC